MVTSYLKKTDAVIYYQVHASTGNCDETPLTKRGLRDQLVLDMVEMEAGSFFSHSLFVRLVERLPSIPKDSQHLAVYVSEVSDTSTREESHAHDFVKNVCMRATAVL